MSVAVNDEQFKMTTDCLSLSLSCHLQVGRHDEVDELVMDANIINPKKQVGNHHFYMVKSQSSTFNISARL